MTQRPTEFLSAVLLVSPDPARLARFYREVIGVDLKEENHDGAEQHYGGQLGDIHFAIHPLAESAHAGSAHGGSVPCGSVPPGSEPGGNGSHGGATRNRSARGGVKLAFEIFDMEGFLARLSLHGVEPLHPPKLLGRTSLITAIDDPDGNLIEFTQLSEGWFSYLEERRMHGHDILQRWKQIHQQREEEQGTQQENAIG